jgi:uncharacterized protein YndB with AHSA1/START domain
MNPKGAEVSPTASLRLERTFDAPPEAVFDAWTNPEVLKRWWRATAAMRTSLAEIDLRVGGAYRLSMEDPEAGTAHTVSGEYSEVVRPERLVYTWCWEQGGDQAGHVSRVSVEFLGHGERTTVVLEHTGLQSEESAERHRHGWTGCIDSLQADYFARAADPS